MVKKVKERVFLEQGFGIEDNEDLIIPKSIPKKIEQDIDDFDRLMDRVKQRKKGGKI